MSALEGAHRVPDSDELDMAHALTDRGEVRATPSLESRGSDRSGGKFRGATSDSRIVRGHSKDDIDIHRASDKDLSTDSDQIHKKASDRMGLMSKNRSFRPVQDADFEKAYLKAHQKDKDQVHIDDKMDNKIALKVWGILRSWQVRQITPANGSCETIHSIRNLRCFPTPEKETALEVLNRFHVGALCAKGAKSSGDTSIGQDSISVSQLPAVTAPTSGGWEVYVVADGHGPESHRHADRAVQALPFFLSSVECRMQLFQGKVREAVTAAFSHAESEIMGLDEPFSGSTATCILRRKTVEELWVANVGDSTAVVFGLDGTVHFSTVDHKADIPEEESRIKAAGGDIVVDELGVPRVNCKDKRYPALAMSRSLGDAIGKSAGVSAVPQIYQWNTSECTDAYVLMASDGIWEPLGIDGAIRVVRTALQKELSPDAALRELFAAAKSECEERGKRDAEAVYTDDMSAIVFPVKHSGASPPKAAAQRCSTCCCCPDKCSVM